MILNNKHKNQEKCAQIPDKIYNVFFLNKLILVFFFIIIIHLPYYC